MSGNKPRDKCGIFGYFGKGKASERTYLGLHNIQHRGQESCGICSWNGENFQIHNGMGIVNDVFFKSDLDQLDGYIAIGHVRYSTSGESTILNAQPILENSVAVAHNGEIVNHLRLKALLEEMDEKFTTGSDTEVVLKLLKKAPGRIEEKISKVFKIIKPSYSLVFIAEGKLIGLRDPLGVRPLEIGKTKTGYVLSSESVGFDIINAEYIREVKPGEMVVIDEDGLRSYQLFNNSEEQRCIFEKIYFSRPDSLLEEGVNIGMVRREFGKQLYLENPIEADIVIDVPDSSFDAAMGVSIASGIPYDKGLIRSHYIGRTFIEPSQELRDAAVLKKFNVHSSVVFNKKVIVVDDSLVRGTTLKDLIRLIKSKGAIEVHVMIGSPPYVTSCNLGVDTSNEKRLIAKHKTIEEIREFIGADSLFYLSLDGMLKNPYLENQKFCTYCFDGVRIIKKDDIKEGD